MFSIAENIYTGWQYLINFLSLSAGNYHIIFDSINKLSEYMTHFFKVFEAPAWITDTIFVVLGFGVVSKLCHWR